MCLGLGITLQERCRQTGGRRDSEWLTYEEKIKQLALFSLQSTVFQYIYGCPKKDVG